MFAERARNWSSLSVGIGTESTRECSSRVASAISDWSNDSCDLRLLVWYSRSRTSLCVTRAALRPSSSLFKSLHCQNDEKELSDSRLLIGQHEAKMKSLSENIKEVESKKRTLEEQMDALNEEVSKMKATEQMHQVRERVNWYRIYQSQIPANSS